MEGNVDEELSKLMCTEQHWTDTQQDQSGRLTDKSFYSCALSHDSTCQSSIVLNYQTSKEFTYSFLHVLEGIILDLITIIVFNYKNKAQI